MKVTMTLTYEIMGSDPITGNLIEPDKETIKRGIEDLTQSYSYFQGRLEETSGSRLRIYCVDRKPTIKKVR